MGTGKRTAGGISYREGKDPVSAFSLPVYWKAKKMKLRGVIKSALSNAVKKLKKVGK